MIAAVTGISHFIAHIEKCSMATSTLSSSYPQGNLFIWLEFQLDVVSFSFRGRGSYSPEDVIHGLWGNIYLFHVQPSIPQDRPSF